MAVLKHKTFNFFSMHIGKVMETEHAVKKAKKNTKE